MGIWLCIDVVFDFHMQDDIFQFDISDDPRKPKFVKSINPDRKAVSDHVLGIKPGVHPLLPEGGFLTTLWEATSAAPPAASPCTVRKYVYVVHHCGPCTLRDVHTDLHGV